MFYENVIASFNRPALRDSLKPEESPFLNRELSWMEFNERCLDEARDKNNPLYERLNFLAITCSNLDEFFQVRVASAVDLVRSDYKKLDPAGLSANEQLDLLLEKNQEFFKRQYSTYNRQIIPALKEEGIHILEPEELNKEQMAELEKYFTKRVYPIITPIAVDAARPFPLVANDSLHLLVILEDKNRKGKEEEERDIERTENGDAFAPFAIVQIPRNIDRVIPLSNDEEGEHSFVLLETCIRLFLHRLFDSQTILDTYAFRIMRSAEFDIAEDEVADLLTEMEWLVRSRERGSVIRLEIEDKASKSVRQILETLLPVASNKIFRVQGPIDFSFLREFYSLVPREDLHYPPFSPQPSPAFMNTSDPFEAIRQGDVLLHHPFESFDPVVQVIEAAAKDPQVLAIKQTLYRVSSRSPIVKALAEAANRGKQVLVLVELKARFDEERNINWARKLEQAGCHVLYGLKGLKTHSKITLIVREEEEGIRRYVHVGTGNYNDSTAKIYTDIGIWSCAEPIGEDASKFFNMISGYSIPQDWQRFVPAPRWLREDTLLRIRRETEHAKNGQRAMIVGKTNSLLDTEIISALYEASQAGVIIRLIVRGISVIRPGIKGLSENIEVRSIVGRFLEHSRIFYYYNNGAEDMLIGSADWMSRNLDQRIELMLQVTDEECRRRIFEILDVELRDTERARIEGPDGLYTSVDRRGKELVDSQIALCESAIRAAKNSAKDPLFQDAYEPRTAPEVV